MNKVCTTCHVELPIEQFVKDSRKRGGRGARCMPCNRKKNQKYRTTPSAKEISARWARKHYEDQRDKGTLQRHGGRVHRDPEKEKARHALNSAIRSGAIVRPELCEDCGEKLPLYGHHEDYSKYLDVNWLCVRCHLRRHRKYK